MSAITKVERRVRTLFDLSHVIGVFVMDVAGETFASMVYPGVTEAEEAGKHVLEYYKEKRESISSEELSSHQNGTLTIHMIRGREGAVAVATHQQANLPGVQMLAKKLASELTFAVMSALTAAAEVEEEEEKKEEGEEIAASEKPVSKPPFKEPDPDKTKASDLKKPSSQKDPTKPEDKKSETKSPAPTQTAEQTKTSA